MSLKDDIKNVTELIEDLQGLTHVPKETVNAVAAVIRAAEEGEALKLMLNRGFEPCRKCPCDEECSGGDEAYCKPQDWKKNLEIWVEFVRSAE